MGPFLGTVGPLKGRPGDDGATSFRNGDLKKRLRVSVSWPKLEEDFELDVRVSFAMYCNVEPDPESTVFFDPVPEFLL